MAKDLQRGLHIERGYPLSWSLRTKMSYLSGENTFKANAKRKFVETVEAHVNLVLITSSDQLDCQGCCVFAEGTAADGSPELQEQILWVGSGPTIDLTKDFP
ncbi:hypothetical protein HPP92_019612 [Vanilla planifolia]|uniref:Uncharacterized protein n=1 Tax=Vanilla planifolia TaxID=51239 RepID=A0A835Q636_VANPL|nr:hypothetical protein HPP92_019612 [Vanilla planifolia]